MQREQGRWKSHLLYPKMVPGTYNLQVEDVRNSAIWKGAVVFCEAHHLHSPAGLWDGLLPDQLRNLSLITLIVHAVNSEEEGRIVNPILSYNVMNGKLQAACILDIHPRGAKFA